MILLFKADLPEASVGGSAKVKTAHAHNAHCGAQCVADTLSLALSLDIPGMWGVEGWVWCGGLGWPGGPLVLCCVGGVWENSGLGEYKI